MGLDLIVDWAALWPARMEERPVGHKVGLGWRGCLSSCLIYILVTLYDLQLATVLIFADGSNASFVH